MNVATQVSGSYDTDEAAIAAPGSGLGRRLYAQQDANFNTTDLLNTTGTVVERFAYDPYGRVTFVTPGWAVTTDAYGWNYLHQGLRYDATLDLADNRWRVDRLALGRPLQADPSGYPDGMNRYAMYDSSPVGGTDPSGLQTLPADDYLKQYLAEQPIYSNGIGDPVDGQKLFNHNMQVYKNDANRAARAACQHFYDLARALLQQNAWWYHDPHPSPAAHRAAWFMMLAASLLGGEAGAPGEVPGEIPGELPGEVAPGEVPPSEVPPTDVPGEAPGEAPGEVPGESAGDPAGVPNGRAGKQSRLRALGDDPNVSSADRGWIQQERNSIQRGQRSNIRLPPGKVLAHRRGFEAAKGFGYRFSDLQDIVLHKLQHSFEGY